ncbi:diguanylate cyclase [Aestuariibacter sp. AA17]|uniref:diguanylate cyclase n=1 Tax=Fluctibacter corallii TaxID=2984329 RepID=A0ABT3A7C4_9ALTE|nr:diguanylate cyclase [Aestuariibacter sp. AA17]MCV2884586.1 diguanylate cyclase [Aestuariibacter sp. AA17]
MLDSASKPLSVSRVLFPMVFIVGALFVYGIFTVSKATQPQYELGNGVKYLQDEQQSMSLEEILQLPESAWQIEEKHAISHGLTNDAYWFQFSLPENVLNHARVIEIAYALIDHVEMWYVSNDKVVAHYRGGDTQPFSERYLPLTSLVFPIPPHAENVQVIMRIQTDGALRVPLRIWDKDRYLSYASDQATLMGLFFGFMLAMMLSNIFHYVTTGNSSFLSYSGYVFFLALAIATLNGLAYKYVWPNSAWFQQKAIAFVVMMALMCAFIFTKQLLNVGSHSGRLNKGLQLLIVGYGLLAFASLFLNSFITVRLLVVCVSVAMPVIYTVGVYCWYKGVSLARYYLLAWSVLLMSGFFAALEHADYVLLDVPSNYLLMIGGTIETFLLALALAINYRNQRDSLIAAQSKALEIEREARAAQEQMLLMREEAQEDLEYKVQERTLELEIALRELSEINRELELKNTIDPLTGLRNRRYFDKKYQAELRRSRREQTALSVVMIDIDHFKSINDQYGHLVGDECIQRVSKLLESSLKRGADEVCRYGGEEFVMVLPSTDKSGAVTLVDGIRQALADLDIATAAGKVNVTLSAGICTAVVRSEEDGKLMLEAADRQLYEAKSRGRNCVYATVFEHGNEQEQMG